MAPSLYCDFPTVITFSLSRPLLLCFLLPLMTIESFPPFIIFIHSSFLRSLAAPVYYVSFLIHQLRQLLGGVCDSRRSFQMLRLSSLAIGRLS